MREAVGLVRLGMKEALGEVGDGSGESSVGTLLMDESGDWYMPGPHSADCVRAVEGVRAGEEESRAPAGE
jgi:hypothetical protein